MFGVNTSIPSQCRLHLLPVPCTVTISVNGQLPGPSIEVISGDRVIITVTNKQPLDLTIHW